MLSVHFLFCPVVPGYYATWAISDRSLSNLKKKFLGREIV